MWKYVTQRTPAIYNIPLPLCYDRDFLKMPRVTLGMLAMMVAMLAAMVPMMVMTMVMLVMMVVMLAMMVLRDSVAGSPAKYAQF
jgi:hypothetical protein